MVKIIKKIYESKTNDGKFKYGKKNIWMRIYLVEGNCCFCGKAGRVFYEELWEGFGGYSIMFHKSCRNKFWKKNA